MPQQIINGVGKMGVRLVSSQTSFDSDAQAFITATAITDTTQKNAINDLVLDLKSAGVWTKMKAIYPMVGGTSFTHQFNLKDPRNLDEAHRLIFYGGWNHSSTGALPNGVDAHANTNLIPASGHISSTSNHFTIYIRNEGGNAYTTDILSNGNGTYGSFGIRGASERNYMSGTNEPASYASDYRTYNSYNADSTDARPRAGFQYGGTSGLFGLSRTISSSFKVFRNDSFETAYYWRGFWFYGVAGTYNISAGLNTISAFYPGEPVRLAAKKTPGGGIVSNSYSSRENAFTTIGAGLTDTEMKFLYRIIEKFQNSLGRSIIAPKAFYYDSKYDAATNEFIYQSGISDAIQISGVTTLVTTLKNAGIWDKLKAVYPMVGGNSTAHSINLKSPGTYNLTFNGGWTHSSTGALPNGTTGWANTNFIPSGILSLHNSHLSYYSRTNSLSSNSFDCFMGAAGNYPTWYGLENLYMGTNNLGKVSAVQHTTNTATAYAVGDTSNRLGLFINTRTSATPTTLKIIKNGVSLGNATTQDNPYARAIEMPNRHIYLASLNNLTNSPSYAQWFSNAECAFASIGDGLTDAEATTFYNAVQAFQTTLGRQV